MLNGDLYDCDFVCAMDSVSLIEDGDEEDDGASFSSSHSSSIFSSKVKFLTLSKSACSETAGNCEEANHSAVRLSCEAGDGVALFPSKKCGCCCGVGNLKLFFLLFFFFFVFRLLLLLLLFHARFFYRLLCIHAVKL